VLPALEGIGQASSGFCPLLGMQTALVRARPAPEQTAFGYAAILARLAMIYFSRLAVITREMMMSSFIADS
jgi:hypothetical protein